jgi:SAM-dependent methyltransferase
MLKQIARERGFHSTNHVPLCDVCGGQEGELKFKVRLHDGPYANSRSRPVRRVFECNQCGHMSVDLYEPDRYQEYYRGLSANYHLRHDQDRWRYEKIMTLLPRTGVRRVLDIGCGSGTFLASFPSSVERFGVELSSAAGDLAKARGIQLLPYEALSLPPYRHSFDLITAIDVVEHTKALSQLLEHFTNALKAGGKLILLTGDGDSRTARTLGRYWYYRHYAEHITFFSARSVRRWLEPTFCDIQVYPTSHHRLTRAEVLILTKIWLLFPAKLALSKIPCLNSNAYAALWAQRDHMFVCATRCGECVHPNQGIDESRPLAIGRHL